LIFIKKIAFGEQQLDWQLSSLSREQKTAGLVGIECRLVHSQSHHHQRHIRHRWSCQPAAARLDSRYDCPCLDGIDRLNPNPVSNVNSCPAMTETRPACAEETPGDSFWRMIQLHLEIVGLQRHNDADQIGHNCSTSTGDHQSDPGLLACQHLNAMTSILESRHHHLLRLTPIELHIELLTALESLQSQLAANEVHRAGGSTQIE